MIVVALVVGLLVAFVLSGLVAVPASFLSMLLLGSLHDDIAAVPALGFWTVFKILWLVAIVGSFWHSNRETTGTKV